MYSCGWFFGKVRNFVSVVIVLEIVNYHYFGGILVALIIVLSAEGTPPRGVNLVHWYSSWSASSKLAILPEDSFLFFCQTSGLVWLLSFALLLQFPGLLFQEFFWSWETYVSLMMVWMGCDSVWSKTSLLYKSSFSQLPTFWEHSSSTGCTSWFYLCFHFPSCVLILQYIPCQLPQNKTPLLQEIFSNFSIA